MSATCPAVPFHAAAPQLGRKRFLQTLALTAAGAFFATRTSDAQNPVPPNASSAAAPNRGPQIEPDLIKRFVTAAHAQLNVVQEMLAERPALINAVWDWGSGDFETALGGASHMGRRDIAEFLLEKGARLDLFAAAALGKLEIIKAAVAAYPSVVHVPGPHTIPLIMHAEKGGSMDVVEFLRPLVTARSR
ncbi:MAG TPA: hypothetical protein VF551_09335 [Chthoniobacterales bacterium]